MVDREEDKTHGILLQKDFVRPFTLVDKVLARDGELLLTLLRACAHSWFNLYTSKG